MKVGDLIISERENGEWATVKILAVDVWPDGSETFHCLSYRATPAKPSIASIDSLDVLAYHAPIDSTDFKANWQVLCTSPVKESDLIGYIEYLKHTNFPRYLEATKQDAQKIVGQANSHYRDAYALGEKGEKHASIQEYTKAIDLFPLFFEAIDNRAFTYMELGDFESAMQDFDTSQAVNPDGKAAFFSRGECFLKMGKLDEAEKVFLEGSHRFQEDQEIYHRFLNITRDKKRSRFIDPTSNPSHAASGSRNRPWWKFWA